MKRRAFLIFSFTFLISHFPFLICNAMQVQTDHDWYLAGEAMEVSVTEGDALIAYAELCDTQRLAAGIMISLRDGAGKGVMELPADLHSGYYLLSVYTRHSTNVSLQLVAVVNALRKSVDDDIEWVVDSVECRVESVEFATALKRCADGTAAANSTLYTLNSTLKPYPETEGHVVLARVKNVYDGHSFSGSEIRPSLSIIGKQIHYFEGKMVDDSTAVFNTFGIHGHQPLVLSAVSSTGVSLPVEMMSPFAALIPKQLPHLVFHYKRSEVEARSLDMQRHQKFSPSSEASGDGGKFSPPSEGSGEAYDETLFGTKPDLSYNLDEYRQFLTIREVLLEYVSCVSKKKTDGVSKLFVRKEQELYNTILPSLVLIDGMPVFDVERLLNYDARRVHYINIYGGQYTFGNGIYNGILSFVTRSGQLTNYPTEPNMQYLVYDFPS